MVKWVEWVEWVEWVIGLIRSFFRTKPPFVLESWKHGGVRDLFRAVAQTHPLAHNAFTCLYTFFASF